MYLSGVYVDAFLFIMKILFNFNSILVKVEFKKKQMPKKYEIFIFFLAVIKHKKNKFTYIYK